VILQKESALSMIKNINISLKLWLIVLPAVLALAALLVYFIIRSNDIQKNSDKVLYDEVYVSATLLINADRDFYQAAIAEKELILDPMLPTDKKDELIAAFDENMQQAQDRTKQAAENLMSNDALFTKFQHPDNKMTLEQAYADFQVQFAAWLKAYDIKTLTGDQTVRQDEFGKARDDLNIMEEILDVYAKTESAGIATDVHNSIVTSVIVISAIIVLIIVLSAVIVIYIRGGIKYITGVSRRIADGELSLKIDGKRKSRDEIGKLCTATGQILDQLNAYAGYIDEVTATLNAMSGGDMRIKLKYDYVGQFRTIKEAFVGISESLGGTLLIIRTASEQVRQGAAAIAAGAQTLAQGSTDQAGAVENLSSTIDTVTGETEKNADGIRLAVESLDATLRKIQESNAYMERMLDSMNAIGQTSNKIRTVIKLIDDIAFQTNILALNAAVEAARAGQYGKGFAVVAAEVKNLASKSANAANQTSELIGSSIRSVEEGIGIAKNTAEALADVSDKVNHVNSIFAGIASSSLEQARAMGEIKGSVSRISTVVLTNSATAEESASASEELSSQAELLYNEVSRFELEGGAGTHDVPLMLPGR
jgi:methyl-accepting chemotaxis protein